MLVNNKKSGHLGQGCDKDCTHKGLRRPSVTQPLVVQVTVGLRLPSVTQPLVVQVTVGLRLPSVTQPLVVQVTVGLHLPSVMHELQFSSFMALLFVLLIITKLATMILLL